MVSPVVPLTDQVDKFAEIDFLSWRIKTPSSHAPQIEMVHNMTQINLLESWSWNDAKMQRNWIIFKK